MMEPMAMLQCVQCARTAEAMGAARLLVLWQGVWVLLVPPLAVFGGILWFAWTRSRQTGVRMAAGAYMFMGTVSRTGERR